MNRSVFVTTLSFIIQIGIILLNRYLQVQADNHCNLYYGKKKFLGTSYVSWFLEPLILDTEIMTFWAPQKYSRRDKNLDESQMDWRKETEIVMEECPWIGEGFFFSPFYEFFIFLLYNQEKINILERWRDGCEGI